VDACVQLREGITVRVGAIELIAQRVSSVAIAPIGASSIS
jgi:hypothetical protein